MSLILFRCDGGDLVLPSRASLLVSRENGGNLVVNPPRPVWERSELTPDELTQFAFLVSAAGRAMIDVLPQLDGGCINYWEAGNWALNDEAEPAGRKNRARASRDASASARPKSGVHQSVVALGRVAAVPGVCRKRVVGRGVRASDRGRVLPDRQRRRRNGSARSTVRSTARSPRGRRATRAAIPRRSRRSRHRRTPAPNAGPRLAQRFSAAKTVEPKPGATTTARPLAAAPGNPAAWALRSPLACA